MKKLILLSLVLLTGVAISFAQLKADHLLTENLVNPQGIDAVQPRFSWQLRTAQKDIVQTAYEIKVNEGKLTVWSSGKVNSAGSVYTSYKGNPLQSGHKYTWQVRVWDNKNNASAFSEPAFFRVGLLNASDWKARWIVPQEKKPGVMQPCPLLRKSFASGKKIALAVAYITAHGMYEAHINGKKIGDAFYTPGWTSYVKRLQYQAYEVTDLLRKGNNTIQVMLGDGWWRGHLGFDGTKMKETYGAELALLFQLELTYSDGTKEWLVSDNSWQSAGGPVQYSDIYQGECINHMIDTSSWTDVMVKDYGYANLVASMSEPVKKQESFAPVKIMTTPNGETVADFGQNLVGFVRISVQGNPGDSVILDHGEVLDKAGNFYNGNLRTARARTIYVLKGGRAETFEPHFTWQGFRYVRISGSKISSPQLQAIALYSNTPETGHFECSNPLINQLQHNIAWTQKGNFIDIPTDCNQRDERLGWLGDAQLFSRTAAYNRNVLPFFTKWLKDLSADQLTSGSVPVVVPNILGGFGGSAGWSDAITILPWNLYELYGDRSVLENQYTSMKAWVAYQEKNSTNYLRNPSFQFGDWLAYAVNGPADPNRSAVTDMDMLAQMFYIRSVQIVAATAKILGNNSDEDYYLDLCTKLTKAFQQAYVTPSGRLMSNTQTAYSLALAYDLLPEELRPAAAAHLVANIKSYNNHLTTGLLGTPLLCNVLSRFGYSQVAYRILLQEDYPGWLYPIKMGATTIWERWDGIKPDGSFQNPTMNSFNHYAFGSIGDWMYQHIAGIQAGEPGYKKIIIKPRPGGDLSYVKADLDTYYGNIGVHWKAENGKFVMDITIPANTIATVFVPKTADAASYDTFSVGSGSYHFESK